MLTAETKRRIDACRDILVGKLPLPTDQVELITLALIYKFMDDLDEESVRMGGQRSFFTGPLAPYRWRNLLPQTVSAEERVTLFSEGIEALGHAQKAAHLPGLFRDIFRNAFLKFRDGRILTLFLGEVNGFEYSHSEELGNAFEYLLQCMGTQGENGQFRTPRHIIDFIVACLDPQPGEKILDPACGTGGFLVSAYKHILAKHTSSPQPCSSGRESAPSKLGRKSEPTHVGCYSSATIPGDLLTHAQRQAVYRSLTGYDITDLMVKLSKVNLFLHGFPDPAIHIYDTLSNDARWHEKADLILANPPFMTPKGGVTPHTKFRIAARKAEVLFTDYIAEHLSADGRGGVIVPNGIVATTQNAYVKLRRFLVEDSLVAVVSLPAGVFKPYSGVKTSILLLDKKLARRTREILFLKITADGFDLGDKRNPIEANDLPEAERVVKAWLGRMTNDEFRMTNGGVSATGAIGSTKGATPSQPGPTARETESAPALRAESPAQRIAWKLVAKAELLANKDITLNAERYMGGADEEHEHEVVTIGEICVDVQSGYSCSASKQAATGVPHLRSQNITDQGQLTWEGVKFVPEEIAAENESYALRQGDILFNNTNSVELVGKTCLYDSAERAHYSNHTTRLRVDEARAIPKFVALALHRLFKRGDFAKLCTRWVGQAGVSTTLLKQVEIPLPPLEEQRRIVAEIEGYQKVLDGARQILAGYRPRIEANPNWPKVTLGQVCEINPKKSEVRNLGEQTEVSFVPMASVQENARDLVNVDSRPLAEVYKGYTYFRENDVVVAKITPCFENGKAAIARGMPHPIAFGTTELHVLRASAKILPEIVWVFVSSEEFRTQGAEVMTGTGGQQRVPEDFVAGFEIPLPPLSEQRRIVAELDAEAAQMEAVRALLPRFEAKIQRVLDRVWGNPPEAKP